MIRSLAVAALLAVLASAAHADELKCFANGDHYVIDIPGAPDIGNRIIVGDFTTLDGVNPCTTNAKFTREFTAKGSNLLAFQALSDDLLVLTESTGPEFLLEVYDLAKPEPLLKVDARDIDSIELGVHYFELGGLGTPATCPNYAKLAAGGMSVVVGNERFFPYSTGQVVTGAATRCYQRP